jgi:hypothetical protein
MRLPREGMCGPSYDVSARIFRSSHGRACLPPKSLASIFLLVRITTDLYRKRPGAKEPNEGGVVRAGRFGPSRKKEAAARRFGKPRLWVFECRADPGSADQRQNEAGVARLIERSGMRGGQGQWMKRHGTPRTSVRSDVWTQVERSVPESTPTSRR